LSAFQKKSSNNFFLDEICVFEGGKNIQLHRSVRKWVYNANLILSVPRIVI